jgi:hypothetical protein
MSVFGELNFAPVPVVAKADADDVIKVTVQGGGVVKLTLNAGAYARLGKPDAVAVAAAETKGGRFLKLTPASLGQGWPVLERDAPKDGGRPSASVRIEAHPFTIGLTHRAQEVECQWGEEERQPGILEPHAHVIVAMPDWAAMLAAIEGGGDE